tara:strand:+ start:558 stop:1007 length:450 start_codon:yes stop_codon:yes gene_type:complete
MDGNLLRQVYEPATTDTNAPSQYHTQHIVVQKSMPTPFQPRESNLRYVWDETNNNNEERFKTLIMAFEPAEIKHVSERRGRRKMAKKVAKLHTRTSDSSVHPTNDGEEEQNLGVVQLETRGVWVITPPRAELERSHVRGEHCGQRENSR